MTTNAVSVALAVINQLTALTPTGQSRSVNTMQLQKLTYYCQAYCLAWTGRPLFSEEVQAWNHGPVVRELWELHKGESDVTEQGLLQRASDAGVSVDELQPDDKIIVEVICESFGSLTGWQLRNRTHAESPWKNHFNENDPYHDKIIPQGEIAKYYAAI